MMSKRTNSRDVFAFADWDKLNGTVFMGRLHAELLRGKEVYSFEYDQDWMKSGHAQLLDPDLQLYSGMQFLNDEAKGNFGLFLDSSPDRWGRILLRRREAAMARLEERPEESLFELDYLLGVFDGHRMGGLRYKLEIDGPFLNDNIRFTSPPWTSIRELEEISLRLEEEDVVDNPDYLKWLNMLVAPGSSLGGARPKASVLDQSNQLWIAKFPSKKDQSDTGGWEMVTRELAIGAGVNMAEAQARRFSRKNHTYLTKRFDRTSSGKRIHFASAMTLLGHSDGQDHVDGVSYLELVDFITSQGGKVELDLEELWRRIVFSICVSNVDDHLRNHGFLLTNSGWVLSPAYDINPIETGTGLKLNISESDNSLNFDLAMDVHEYFRLSEDRAHLIIQEVRQSVQAWNSIATRIGISKSEQEIKSRAFQSAY
jgi:serine/threonine-protein kinase HipA